MSRLAPHDSASAPPPPSAGRGRRVLVALFPLVLLATVIGAIALARANPKALFVGLFVLAAALPLAWLTVSALWPARADRTCPTCGAAALERLDANSTHGLGCRACGWRDESASGWLLAEEEGPLEPLVLARRPRVACATDPLEALDSRSRSS